MFRGFPYLNFEIVSFPMAIIKLILSIVTLLIPGMSGIPRRMFSSLSEIVTPEKEKMSLVISCHRIITFEQCTKKCSIKSLFWQKLQFSDGDIFILYNKMFVGYIFCRTFQHNVINFGSLIELIIFQCWLPILVPYFLSQNVTQLGIVGWYNNL